MKKGILIFIGVIFALALLGNILGALGLVEDDSEKENDYSKPSGIVVTMPNITGITLDYSISYRDDDIERAIEKFKEGLKELSLINRLYALTP